MSTPTTQLMVDGEPVDTFSLYSYDPVLRYRFNIKGSDRYAIRTGDQVFEENPDVDQEWLDALMYGGMTQEELEFSAYGRKAGPLPFVICWLLGSALGAIAYFWLGGS